MWFRRSVLLVVLWYSFLRSLCPTYVPCKWTHMFDITSYSKKETVDYRYTQIHLLYLRYKLKRCSFLLKVLLRNQSLGICFHIYVYTYNMKYKYILIYIIYIPPVRTYIYLYILSSHLIISHFAERWKFIKHNSD